MPNMIVYAVTITALFFLSSLNLSIILATMASMTDTEDDTAANITIKKNSMPTAMPILPIWLNTLGKEINISHGPALIPSVPANTNTAGTIISPARIATRVSKNSIWLIDLFMFVLSGT